MPVAQPLSACASWARVIRSLQFSWLLLFKAWLQHIWSAVSGEGFWHFPNPIYHKINSRRCIVSFQNWDGLIHLRGKADCQRQEKWRANTILGLQVGKWMNSYEVGFVMPVCMWLILRFKLVTLESMYALKLQDMSTLVMKQRFNILISLLN